MMEYFALQILMQNVLSENKKCENKKCRIKFVKRF